MYYISTPIDETNKPFILTCFLTLQEAIKLAKKSMKMFHFKRVDIVSMEKKEINFSFNNYYEGEFPPAND